MAKNKRFLGKINIDGKVLNERFTFLVNEMKLLD